MIHWLLIPPLVTLGMITIADKYPSDWGTQAPPADSWTINKPNDSPAEPEFKCWCEVHGDCNCGGNNSDDDQTALNLW